MEEMGTSFHKMEGNEMVFKLKDLECEEQYKIWDTETKTWYQGDDMLESKTGETIAVKQTKFIKTTVFQEYFPGKRKNTQFMRTIVIGGEDKKFGFKKTANDDLDKLIGTLKATKQDPLQVSFKLTKTGSGKETRYQVAVADSSEEVQVNLDTKESSQDNLSDKEMKLIDTYKKGIKKEDWNESDFIKVANSNNLGIAELRLKEIFKEWVMK